MILLKLFLLALSLLGYCLFFHRKIGIPAEFTPFFTVTSLMTCLYVLGYAGSLEFNAWGVPAGFNPLTVPTVPVLYYGVRLLYVLGFCCGLLWWRSIRREKSGFPSERLNPGLVFFFAGFFLIFFPLQSSLMRHTDDIHHWGLAVKCLSIYHSFPGVDSGLYYAEYPPGVPLFHYYISTFTNFREGTLFFSHNLMLLSGAVVLMYRIPWKYFYVLLLIPFFAFVLQNLFMHGPRYLMVDTTLSVFLGASLYLYFASAMTAVPFPQRLIPLMTSAVALVLTKHVGLIFASILCAVVLADGLVVLLAGLFRRNREVAAGEETASSRCFRRCFLKTILPTIVFLALPLAASESWNLRYENCPFPAKDLSRPGIVKNAVGAFRQMENEIPLAQWPRALFDRVSRERWLEAFEKALPENRTTIPGRFCKALFQQELNGFDNPTDREGRNLTTCSMTLALGLTTGLLLFSSSLRGFRCRYLVLNLVLFIGAGGYLCFMLLVYLFAFDDVSALRLASFQRYVGTYFHAWLLATFGMSSFCLVNSGPKWNPKRLAVLFSCILLVYLFLLGLILIFAFEEIVDWGPIGFLVYVAVYFRSIFTAMLAGLAFCFRKCEAGISPFVCLCSRLVWVLFLVFILVKSEFSFRVSQTAYALEHSFRQEVRDCLRQIESKRNDFTVLRVIFEADILVDDGAAAIVDSYEYETYPETTVTLETFGMDFREKWKYQVEGHSIDTELFHSRLNSPEEWAKSLIEGNVDALFLHKTDDFFWKRYAGLFENGNDARKDDGRFYRVTTLPDRTGVLLIEMPSTRCSKTTKKALK